MSPSPGRRGLVLLVRELRSSSRKVSRSYGLLGIGVSLLLVVGLVATPTIFTFITNATVSGNVCKANFSGGNGCKGGAGGTLTGRYRRESTPEDARFANAKGTRFERFVNERMYDVIEDLEALCAEKNVPVSQLALKWVHDRTGVTSAIIGPRTMEQFDDNIAALDVELTEDRFVAVIKTCPFFDNLVDMYGKEEASDMMKKTIGATSSNYYQALMKAIGLWDTYFATQDRFRCLGDGECRMVYTRRSTMGDPA